MPAPPPIQLHDTVQFQMLPLTDPDRIVVGEVVEYLSDPYEDGWFAIIDQYGTRREIKASEIVAVLPVVRRCAQWIQGSQCSNSAMRHSTKCALHGKGTREAAALREP